MTTENALEKAVAHVGSMSILATAIGVTKGAVSQWKLPGRRIPAEHCPLIERMTGGAVRCEELRPDVDWAFIRSGDKGVPCLGRARDSGHAGRQPPSPTNIFDTVPEHSVVGVDPRGAQ